MDYFDKMLSNMGLSDEGYTGKMAAACRFSLVDTLRHSSSVSLQISYMIYFYQTLTEAQIYVLSDER